MIYTILLFIHVITAVIGIGQTFLYPVILKMPKSGQQVRFVGMFMSRFAKMAKYSDYTLLISGFLMLAVSEQWFSIGWTNVSLILFVALRCSSRLLSKKTASALWEEIETIEGDQIPPSYHKKVNAFMPFLLTTQVLVFLILTLMIIKPSIPFS